MPAEKYTEAYLTEQLPAEIKEQLRADGLSPARRPSYEYLNAKGFSTRGLNKAVQRHFGEEMTLHEHLVELGFGVRLDDEWPTQHPETLSLLNGFRESRRDRKKNSGETIETIESALRKVLRISQRLHNTDNLLLYARFDSEQEKFKRNKQIEAILDEIHEELSGGAAGNYTRYFGKFYEYVSLRTPTDYNPVAAVDHQYSHEYTSRDVQRLTDEQQRALWRTVQQLPERKSLCKDVDGLVKRHGLERWRVYMMLLLLLGLSVGPRSKEYVRMDCRNHWHTGDDAYIEFPIRKNQPGEVPVLTHPDFLKAYREFMEVVEDDWNGKPFPSDTSASGSVTPATLNNWLRALCKEAGLQLEDGDYPTLQNLRQSWHSAYKEVLRNNKVQLKIVAEEAGTEDEDQVDASYTPTEEERKTIRELACEDFQDNLPLDELPDIMADALDEVRQPAGSQANLTDF